jgi:hypothetical protein
MTTTYESEKVICPIAWAVVPRPIWLKICRNSSSSATPMTISGVTSGSSMSTLTVPLPRPRQRCRPSASVTPSGVAISTEMRASTSVCLSADWSASSWNTLRFGSVQNQRREKPSQAVRERPLLNAKRIAMITGTTDQMM